MKVLAKVFIFFIVFVNFSDIKAEIIQNEVLINKEFGSWIVSCKQDIMFDKKDCKLFTEITAGTVLFINPNVENNKIVLISKDIISGSKTVFKVDRYDFVETYEKQNNQYNLVDMDVKAKKTIFNQMKAGNSLFLRFTVKDESELSGTKKITAKLSLADFTKALIYFESRFNPNTSVSKDKSYVLVK